MIAVTQSKLGQAVLVGAVGLATKVVGLREKAHL